MRRRDREVTEWKEICEILDRAMVIRLGMHDGDDIYILPMNYGYISNEEEIVFYMHCGKEGKKLDLLEKNGNVAFELDCDHSLLEGRVACQYGYAYACMMGKGKALLVEDADEKIKALSVIMRTQTGKDFEFNKPLVSIVKVVKLIVTDYSVKRRPIK